MSKKPEQGPVISLDELKKRLKKDAKVLWLYQGNVETGDVLFVNGENVDLIWLEGYKSRNDTVPFSEILAIWDPEGPAHEIFPFSGPGYLTEAGAKWIAEHPRA